MNNLVKIDVETREQMVQYMKENVDENINKQKQVIAHFEAWMRWLDSKVTLHYLPRSSKHSEF